MDQREEGDNVPGGSKVLRGEGVGGKKGKLTNRAQKHQLHAVGKIRQTHRGLVIERRSLWHEPIEKVIQLAHFSKKKSSLVTIFRTVGPCIL